MADAAPALRRVWGMPTRWTFRIKPICELLERYVGDGRGWIDPFAGTSSLAEFRNDLNPEMPCPHHMLADEWLRGLPGTYRGGLFDPPYSGRQVKECYSHLNRTVHRDDTNAYFYANVKRAMAPRIEPGGLVICCGWNSNGFGRGLGFELEELLLVAHGSAHNDTVVTVERKLR
jgi:hypothetical protein